MQSCFQLWEHYIFIFLAFQRENAHKLAAPPWCLMFARLNVVALYESQGEEGPHHWCLVFFSIFFFQFLPVWRVQVGGRHGRQQKQQQVIPGDVRHLLPLSTFVHTSSRNDSKDKSWVERGGGFTFFFLHLCHVLTGSTVPDPVLAAGADRWTAVSVLSFPITPRRPGAFYLLLI